MVPDDLAVRVRESLGSFNSQEQAIGEMSGTHPRRVCFRVGFCCQCNIGELDRREQYGSLLYRLFQHEAELM